jgi:hypothetical protein
MKIFVFRWREITAEWRKVRHEELHNLYSSNTIRVTTSRGMRWARHVAGVKED